MTDSASEASNKSNMKLFWACFVALVATSFVFGARANLMGTIGSDLKLSKQEIGMILGVGLWPFALSILFFSFLVDRIGYKTVAVLAIICHVVSIAFTVAGHTFQSMYFSTFLIAIANGMVECFINPVVATVFSKQKAKWLNILHAGWPAGMALGGVTATLLHKLDWHIVYSLCFLPVVVYTVLLLPLKLPVNERVAAGVTFRDMLKQVGALGFFIIGALVAAGIAQLVDAIYEAFGAAPQDHSSTLLQLAIGVGVVVGALGGLYTRSLGNWLFLAVLITMGPLATTELGTDSWMEQLLSGDLPTLAGWVFVLVSIIMTILRFCAGPIVHRFSPIGLLVCSAAVAIVGLLLLSQATSYAIIAAAIVYALGKTFLWSTTLGMVSEQFPKGGALTLNGVSAVGVLALGIFGSPMMGWYLDKNIDTDLQAQQPALHQKVSGPIKPSLFGPTPSLNEDAVAGLPPADQAKVQDVIKHQKKEAFARQAVLPGFMLVCYLGMFLYFKSRGGYKPVELGHAEEAEPGF